MNITNPSVEEIRKWAHSGNDWPHEEWDLFLSWTCEVNLFIELATDDKCKKMEFFRHMLYYVIGTTYSEPNKTDKLERIASYYEKGRGVQHSDIKKWVNEIDLLLSNKKKYTYENWRGGMLANYKFT